MKAIRIKAYGGSEKMLFDDIPTPVCGSNDLLVRVVAAGINPIDWKIRSGAMEKMIVKTLPLTIGWDAAGIVTSIGSSVTNFKVGDEVFFYAEFTRGGTYAEYVTVDALQVALKPRTVPFVSAAALPIPGQAAWTSIMDIAKVSKGMRVLIHGGAGSLGSIAIQLAKYEGAFVYTTASGAGIELAKSFGADQVIDYKKQRFQDIVKDLDIVLDTIGDSTQENSWGTLKPGGMLLATAIPPSPERAAAAGVKSAFVFTQPQGSTLEKLAARMDEGHLRILVGQEFSLKDAGEAHRLGENGKSRGKMILHVGQPNG
jgi:NADPH:quinone reductase-like Zn-dependent oxidoreductase